MSTNSTTISRIALMASAVLAAAAPGASLAEGPRYATSALIDRSIGYVVVSRQLAVNPVDDPVGAKTDCPEGLNEGPREQFIRFHPDESRRSVVDALKREGQMWFPTADFVQPNKYHEPVGKIANGMNLDGKVKATDFTTPTGEPGIDNGMFRALGCIDFFRRPSGVNYYVEPILRLNMNWNRVLMEITDVDDLTNDSQVTVTFYQGMDDLVKDAKGEATPRGSNRISERFGKKFVQSVRASITNGELKSEPFDLRLPDSNRHGEFTEAFMRGARLKLKVNPDRAEGLLAGYLDLDTVYYSLARSWDSAHTAYGAMSLPSVYSALSRHADGFPDAQGRNTAISGAWELKLVQSYILRSPDKENEARTQTAEGRGGTLARR